MFLPREWWKLSFLWFAQLESRSPRAKRGLFRTSFKVSVLSLSLGVAALSLTLAVVSGFEWTLGEAVSRSQGHIVHASTKWRSFEDLDIFIRKAPPGLRSAEYFWTSQGLLVGKKGGRGVLIEGRRNADLGTSLKEKHPEAENFDGIKSDDIRVDKIQADDYKFSDIKSKNIQIDKAQFTDSKNENSQSADVEPGQDKLKLTLGSALADYLGVQVGDNVKLLLPGVFESSLPATVVSLNDNGMYEIDSRMALLDDRSLRNVLAQSDPEALANRPGDAHGIRFFLDSEAYPPSQRHEVEKWAAAYRNEVLAIDSEEDPGRIQSWYEQKNSLFEGIAHNKLELSVIVGLLSLVAALNIAATLVVLFLERDREIAVIRAMGLSRFQVLQWVGIQGFLLGLLSAVLGLVLGRVFAFVLVRLPVAQIPSEIYNVNTLPLKFLFVEQSQVFLFGVGAALLSALILGVGLSRVNLVSVLGSRR